MEVEGSNSELCTLLVLFSTKVCYEYHLTYRCELSDRHRWSYGGNRLHLKSEAHLLADVESSIHNTESIGLHSVRVTASLKAKQDLLLLLLSSEQARLMVWLNPSAHERRKYFSMGQSKLSQEVKTLPIMRY